MAGSVREYAVLFGGGRSSSGGGAIGGGGAVGGGNTLLATPQHKLDGPEHLAADDDTRLNASTTAHGLMAKLSGTAGDVFHGDGTQGPLLAAQVPIVDAGSYLVATQVETALQELAAAGASPALRWIPTTAYDPVIGAWLPVVDGSGNAVMVEV